MAYDEHLQDFPTCTSVPHAILNAQIVYCPHDGGYTMTLVLGDTGPREWSHLIARYGPFDDITDLASDLGHWLAALGRRMLLDAALAEHERSRTAVYDDSSGTPK